MATGVKIGILLPVTLNTTLLDNLKVTALDHVYVNDTLNTALKGKLAAAFSPGNSPTLAALIGKLGGVDIAASKDLTIRAFVANQLMPMVAKDPAAQRALDAEVAKLSSTTTVGALLGLDKPLKDHPLFRPDVFKVDLSSLLATSPLIAGKQLQDEFVSLYAAHQGPIENFWATLRQNPDFHGAGVVESLQFTLQLSFVTFNNTPLVAALQSGPQAATLKTPRDLVKLDANAWTQLMNTQINGQPVPVPDAVPGATRPEQVTNYISGIMEMLKTVFPTAALALDVGRPPAIDLSLIRTVLARNPRLNVSTPPPANLDLTGIPTESQANARASLEALRREVKTFPEFDYKSAIATPGGTGAAGGAATQPAITFQNPIRDGVAKVLASSPDLELRTDHLDKYVAAHPAAINGVAERDRDAVMNQIRRFQRVLRVTTKVDAVNTLLGEGLDSAYQISRIPQRRFIEEFGQKLGSDADAARVHAQAQQVNASAMNLHAHVYQALHDVAPRVIGPVADKVKDVLNKRFGGQG
jgi:hypothetical protein